MTQTNLPFEDLDLVGRLSQYNHAQLTRFAASCVEVLLPLNMKMRGLTGSPLSLALSDSAEALWEDEDARTIDIENILAFIPNEDAGLWSPAQAVWATATSSIAYALRVAQGTSITAQVADARWAAYQVYDAAEFYLQHRNPDFLESPVWATDPVVSWAIEWLRELSVRVALAAGVELREQAARDGIRYAALFDPAALS